MGHLRYVHGYDSVDRIEPVSVDGSCLESRFDFRSIRKVSRIATLTLELSASTRVFGLGYSFVEIRNPRRWIAGLGFLPLRLRAPIMNKFIASMQYRDVQQDVVI